MLPTNNAQFYLHNNGSIIFKPEGGVDIEPGGFVREVWYASEAKRTPETFFRFLCEARVLGALRSEIERVANAHNLETYLPGASDALGISRKERANV